MKYQIVINRKAIPFDSISISSHEFFGFDEPMGIFITTNDVLVNQNPFHVEYLNDAVPTITCSRSGLAAIKFWWKVNKNGVEGFRDQAETILSNAKYLKAELDEIGYPAWLNQYSNTVFFKRPDQAIMDKWSLAPAEDTQLGGKLAHAIVLQHVTREVVDVFIADIKNSLPVAYEFGRL